MKTLYKLLAIGMILGLAFTALPAALVQAESTIKLGTGLASYLGADAVSTDNYIGTGAWSANGHTMEFYISPSMLGLSSIKVDDIDSIIYHTKDDTPGGVDWGFYIYTDGTKYGWYEERLIFEPMYSKNYDGAPANVWNTWQSNTGTNQIAFYDGHYGPQGSYYGPYLADIKDGPINWASYFSGAQTTSIDYGAQNVKYFKFGTGSAWSSTFTGLLDSIEFVISGQSYIIDLEDLLPTVYVDDSWSGTSVELILTALDQRLLSDRMHLRKYRMGSTLWNQAAPFLWQPAPMRKRLPSTNLTLRLNPPMALPLQSLVHPLEA
jgi:hypothetical protein